MKFKDYITEICQFYRDNGLRIDPVPSLRLDRTEVSEFDPLIQTGNYNPSSNTITLFIGKRHLKDILRSYCHELVHRAQHLEMGQDFERMNKSGNLTENGDLEDLEGDAYRRGNLMFRKWTESKTVNKDIKRGKTR